MLSSKQSLSTFPFLTAGEFDCACRFFLDRIRGSESPDRLGWSAVRLEDLNGLTLRITRNIEDSDARHDDDLEDEALEVLEDDPEALIRTTSTTPSLQVEYDIILSPSYQVPVLYFSLRRPQKGPVDLETVYRYLVPEQYRREVGSVGVMGGISCDYHPGSGAPAFFVHPCNTADAMTHIAGWQNVTAERYLLIWLGLVGNCVGLRVPHEPFSNEIIQDPKVPLT